MDDIVKQAMAKWPQVPDCYGWLGFDDRGDWYMRDDGVQALGQFSHAKGSKLMHVQLIAFIERNYGADVQGRWYFQNGPQRVYVELQSTPFVWRVQEDGMLTHAHLKKLALKKTLLDENGRLYVLTEQGLGLVHSLDTWHAANAIEEQRWPAPLHVLSLDLPKDYGYVLSPASDVKKPAN
jgi:hypothetical protein